MQRWLLHSPRGGATGITGSLHFTSACWAFQSEQQHRYILNIPHRQTSDGCLSIWCGSAGPKQPSHPEVNNTQCLSKTHSFWRLKGLVYADSSCQRVCATSTSLSLDLTGAPRCSSTENPEGKSDVTRAGCYSPTKVSKSLKSHVTVLSMWHVIRSLAPPWSQQDPHQYVPAHPQRELLVNLLFFLVLPHILLVGQLELWMCERFKNNNNNNF